MDAVETLVLQTTIADAVLGFGLSLSYYSAVVVVTTMTMVVALAEWVIYLAVTAAIAETAAANGLSS